VAESRHPAPARVGVAGCGLIGGSVLLGLASSPNYVLSAFDPDAAVCDRLERAGIETVPDLESLARTSDIAVVCAPPASTATVVASLLRASEQVIVTDVASVKSAVIESVVELVGAQVAQDRFVAGHPLAGRERHGFGAASADLFDSSVWALCPSSTTPLDAVLRIARLAWSLGASVLTIDSSTHDVAVAFSSHAPHIVASAIAQAPPPELRTTIGLLSGGGLRDATRVAASDGNLWVQIVNGNRRATLAALDAQQAALAELRGAVEREDWPTLAEQWDKGRAATEALLAARWRPRSWSTISVPTPTSEVLLALGRSGQLLRACGIDLSGDLSLEISAIPAAQLE
jgi:prephenate dehydrogenase